MPVGLLGIITIVALVLVLSSGTTPTVGYDISYPQCSGAYPSNPRFGIVGVNGGLANTANACLGDELAWARGRAGATASPPAGSVVLHRHRQSRRSRQ